MSAITTQDLWFNQPVLDENETVYFELPANYSQGRRAVGGKLFASTHRLVFVPNRVEAKLYGKVVSIPKSEIVNVSKVDATFSIFELFSGAILPRLSVRLRDGSEYRFVVNFLEEALSRFDWYLAR